MNLTVKRRKRKFTSNEITVKTEKKAKKEENNCKDDKTNNSCTSDNENAQKINLTTEENNTIDGKSLRSSFKSPEGLHLLQKFVRICEEHNGKDLASEYLEAGGNILEILRLLDKSEKKNINNAASVFAAIHVIIIKILGQCPQYQSAAQEACRHLINSNLTCIHSMLSNQSKAKHRKIVLKLLAAIVSLGGTLPREILNHLSLHNVLIEVLVAHSKPTDRQSVRVCFIHFILAFLIEGNAFDIKALLEKRGVLTSIFSGLIYDYPDVVQLVLSTVKKYVLANPAITKTIKLYVFSTPVVLGLVNLYNWKGPKNWPGYKKQKLTSEYIDLNEKEITVNAVHEFLLILLTSKRHGIAFHDRSLGINSSRKNNQLINTILQSLDKPWEHEKPSELVVKILSACPDLIKSQLLYTEPFLVPRASKNWMAAVRFVTKIINNINVENCLKLCTEEMTIVQISNAILSLTLPSIVIKNLLIPSLDQNNPIIHHEIVILISAMIKKAENFVESYKNIELNSSQTLTLKNIILDHIIKHMPNFESLLNVWIKAFSINSEIQNADENNESLNINLKDHLLAILNLLEVYIEVCPDILMINNVKNIEKKSMTLLTNLCNLQNFNEEELSIMKTKAIKILLYANSSGFSPTEETFKIALSFLISKVGDKDTALDLEICETIYLFLSRCGMFEEHKDQIEIWIYGFTYFQTLEEKLEIADWISNLMKCVSEQTEKYISSMYKAEQTIEEEIMNLNREEDIFNELCERSIEDVKLINPMLPVISIPLLLYASIEDLRKCSNVIKHYMSIILTHTLHCQVLPTTFISLIEELKLPTDTQKYLTGWSSKNSLIPIKQPFKLKCIFRTISDILLSSNKVYKISVQETGLCIQFENSTKNYTLNNFKIKSLYKMTIFYLTQALQRTEITIQSIEIYTIILLSLLQLANKMEHNLINDCVKWMFKHPLILQHFKAIYKNNDTSENAITSLLINILTFLFYCNKESTISILLHPYQEKFVTEIKRAIKKYKDNDSTKKVKAHVELLQLLQFNKRVICDLLSTVISLPKEKFLSSDKLELSVWGAIIPKLVESFSEQFIKDETFSCNSIDTSILKKLVCYLVQLKTLYKLELDMWENCIYDYLLKFPHSISIIDEKIFTSLINTNINSSTIKLLNLFVERNSKFITVFSTFVNNNENILREKFVIFSILSSNLCNKWNQDFLKKLCKYYKSDIVLFLTEPKDYASSWILENVNAIEYLIDNVFDSELCKEICDIILSNGDKLDTVTKEHVKLYNILFKKSLKINPDALKDFVQVLVHTTVIILKRDSKNTEKLNFFCNTLIETINTLNLQNNFTFAELTNNFSWSQFIRINLKQSLKITKEDKKNNLLLKSLIITCDVAYKDNDIDEYVKTIFEMTTSHSEFVNIMLSDSGIKCNLLELLLTLIRKNHALMSTSHIPLYLASYNATLKTSDKFILKILQYYECNGIKLGDYKPYLWGNAAASHYSIKNEIDTALLRQPSTSQVLDLLNPEIVNNTIKNFPVERNRECHFTNTVPRLDQVYDPIFYLPVFSYLLENNNLVACHKFIHSGALALSIIACSSTCDQMRLAAFTVISRFYFHLEATSSKDKLLWINFIDSLRNGILNTELPLQNIKLNGFVATFLARSCLLMTQPLNPLYSPLQSFLMAKPALDLNTVPELLQLYHSSEVEHRAHRHWILEVICDGLKTDNDMKIALKCVLFKMLLDFYMSTLSDKESKILILQIIKSATMLTKSCMILVNGYALLPWLLNVTEELYKSNMDITACVIDITNNILNVFYQLKSKQTLYFLMLLKILLQVKTHFNHNLTVECLTTYISVLRKVIINNSVCSIFTKSHMNDIVKISKKLLDDIRECEAIMHFGCKFVKRKDVKNNNNLSPKDSLYELILMWYNHSKINK